MSHPVDRLGRPVESHQFLPLAPNSVMRRCSAESSHLFIVSTDARIPPPTTCPWCGAPVEKLKTGFKTYVIVATSAYADRWNSEDLHAARARVRAKAAGRPPP